MDEILKTKFRTIVNEHNWSEEEITVTAQTLSPEEAIGNPEEDDYPILTLSHRKASKVLISIIFPFKLFISGAIRSL